MFGRVGVTEVLIVLVILLLLFGGKKLPQLAKGLGEAMNELRSAAEGKKTEEKEEN